ATVSAPTFSLAISSSTGATILHGPHHVAQKSTSTGTLLDSTSSENESSVTATVAEVFSVIAVLQSNQCCHRLWRKLFRRASARRRWRPNSRCLLRLWPAGRCGRRGHLRRTPLPPRC